MATRKNSNKSDDNELITCKCGGSPMLAEVSNVDGRYVVCSECGMATPIVFNHAHVESQLAEMWADLVDPAYSYVKLLRDSEEFRGFVKELVREELNEHGNKHSV